MKAFIKVKNVLLGILLCLFLTCTCAFAKNLVIIGWDGAGMRNVNLLLAEGKLPNMQHLMDEHGFVLVPLEPLHRTSTITTWAQFVTGMTGDQTGVESNEKWTEEFYPGFAKKNGQYKGYWKDQILFNDTIFSYFKERGYKIGWFVSKDFLGPDPNRSPFTNIVLNSKSQAVIMPGNNNTYQWDLFNLTKEFIKANAGNDFVVFLHLDPDAYGHREGENSERYLREFITCDNLMGRIHRQLEYLGLDASLMAISDHGFDEGKFGHMNAPDIFMLTDMPIYNEFVQHDNQHVFGTMRDVVPTIMKYFDIEQRESDVYTRQLRGKSLLQ